MADFLLSVGIDVNPNFEQMQSDISGLVTRLNANQQRVRIGLEIDQGAIERFRTEIENIHNSMGGLGRVTVNPVDTAGLNNAVDSVARLTQNTQGAISAVHTISTGLNAINAERVQNALSAINNISPSGAAAIAKSLSELNVTATEATTRFSELANAQQQLISLQLRGVDAQDNAVNYLISYNTKTGEVKRTLVEITTKLGEVKSAEATRATTVKEVTDQYRQMLSLMKANPNAAGTQAYTAVSDQANVLRDALNLAHKATISIDEAFSRAGTSGATAMDTARNAVATLRLEMEKTGSSGALNITTMFNTIAQAQSMISNNPGFANTTAYKNLNTQVSDLVRVMSTASHENMTFEETLKQTGINGNTALFNLKQAMAEFRIETSGAIAEEERLTIGTANYQSALDKINTLLRRVRTNTEKWSAAKTGKSSADYQIYADQARELENLARRMNTGTITAREFNAEYVRIKSTVSGAETAIKSAGEATQSWSDRIGKLAGKFSTWFSITRVVMAAYRAIRKMITNVIELDTAMTELKKVTNETNETYDRFLVNATKRAKELGATLTDTVSATADFARLGYSIDEATKLADAAIVYKNVGDGIEDINTASESIIATMQAFGIGAESAMNIVDKFNEVGNNYAISSSGVGDALLRSAAAMYAANNSLDETIALAAAANTIVQDPDKVGKRYAQQYSNVLKEDSYIG